MDNIHIRCPKCNWEPKAHDRWMCECEHLWNTFDTGGRCPACNKVWEYTQCIACLDWSPHLDWYENLDSVLTEVSEAIGKPVAL